MNRSLAELERATRLIAGTYRGPHCVEAAALTVEVGSRLGYELDARPVSMFAATTDGQTTVIGVQGRAFGEQFLRRYGSVEIAGEFEGGTSFQREAGHMIVVSEEHRLLLDPTFAQFHLLGDAATALFVSEVDARGKGRFWHVEDEHFFVRYFAADDFMVARFHAMRALSQDRADEIVEYIRYGPTSHN